MYQSNGIGVSEYTSNKLDQKSQTFERTDPGKIVTCVNTQVTPRPNNGPVTQNNIHSLDY